MEKRSFELERRGGSTRRDFVKAVGTMSAAVTAAKQGAQGPKVPNSRRSVSASIRFRG